MATVHARIRSVDGHESVLPVVVPELPAVREFARQLHRAGEAWNGDAFGWQGEYVPQSGQPPLDSQLAFTPAEFCTNTCRSRDSRHLIRSWPSHRPNSVSVKAACGFFH
ncbi:MAG: hypothetical protein NTW36_01365 [Planctomycetia bacterium]|nr:hypothetical protein [Planctomycetia bacterium]